ncbi:Replication termination factor 2 [Aphelenchoides fujianensis]|nr:Replication termination factor 2 [Aphelenchoides fujianensis]
MGADGGTIPKRCELVRKKKKAEKVDKVVVNAAKWTTCQLLYNKEAVLEGLLNKTLAANAITRHIKSRADFRELNLVDNKEYKGDGPKNGNTYIDHNNTQWICPITSLPMNGITNFNVNFDCGCVISERATAETRTTDVCLGCNGPVRPERIVQLYPDEELLARYEEQLAPNRWVPGQPTDEPPAASAAPKLPTAAATAERKRKAEKPLSIQDDPNVSGAVKSLFTTSEEEKKKPEGPLGHLQSALLLIPSIPPLFYLICLE